MYQCMQYAMDRMEDACLPLNDMTVRMLIDVKGMPDIQRTALGFTTDAEVCLDVVFTTENDRHPLIRMSHPSQSQPNKVIKRLIRTAEEYVDKRFSSDAQQALWRLHQYVQARLYVFTERCVVCDKVLNAPGLKPVPCEEETCAFAFEDLGVGSGLDDVHARPRTADLLVLLAAAAVCAFDQRRAAMFKSLPNDFIEKTRLQSAWEAKWDVIKSTIGDIPAIRELRNRKDEEIREMIGELPYKLLRWILNTNRAVITWLEPYDQIEVMKTPHQFAVVVDTSSKANAFQTLKEAEGSYYAFHGSNLGNWHAILRNGLKNYSNTHMMSAGAVHGAGIYLALNSSTSAGYCVSTSAAWSASEMTGGLCCLALCEVIGKPSASNGIAVIPQEEYVSVRFLFVYSSRQIPSINADSLKTHRVVLMNEKVRSQMAGNASTFSQSSNLLTETDKTQITPLSVFAADSDPESFSESDSLFSESDCSSDYLEYDEQPEPSSEGASQHAADVSLNNSLCSGISNTAQLRLQKDLRTILTSDRDCGRQVELVDGNLLMWDAKLWLTSGSLAEDLKQYQTYHGQDYVHLRLEFPDDYPNNPPFVYVLSPVMEYGTAFISHGAVCTTLLLNSGTAAGWSSVYTVDSILMSIQANFQDPSAKGRIRQIKQPLQYSRSEAVNGWQLTKSRHGW